MNERFPGESRNDEDRDRDRGDGRVSMDGILDDADEDVSCSSVIFRFDRFD